MEIIVKVWHILPMAPPRRHFPHLLARSFVLRALGLWLLMALPALAVVFHDTADANHNSDAPSGLYASAGWQFEGYFGSFLGTMIAPQHFLTAQHIGDQGATFIHKAAFSGDPTDVAYTVDTAANGGLGYWDIAGTDFRVFKVNEVFPYFADLYTGTGEVGETFVTMGRGGPRGADVIMSAELKGWQTGSADGMARWGANEVTAVQFSPVGDLLRAEFNASGVAEEASLSVGDSGGGVFILDGGVWKLAGINYATDGYFDTNDIIGDNSHFSGAIFDKGGLYEGSDGGGWTLHADEPSDIPASLYVSRVSTSAGAILAVVPEPGTALLILLALGVRRRSRR